MNKFDQCSLGVALTAVSQRKDPSIPRLQKKSLNCGALPSACCKGYRVHIRTGCQFLDEVDSCKVLSEACLVKLLMKFCRQSAQLPKPEPGFRECASGREQRPAFALASKFCGAECC